MSWIFDRIADNRVPGSWASRLRERRFRLFRELIQPLERPVRVLDVGGDEAFWASISPSARSGLDIVVLNQRSPRASHGSGLSFIEGDARDMSALSNRDFDVVFSNSVIEHVGGRRDQERMANEVMRVGRHYFVQTPNRFFPIEPHFLVPGFQFLPVDLRVALVRRMDLGWKGQIANAERARAAVLSLRLLSAREMGELFPMATLHRERVFGLTKSLIACA